MKIEIKYVVIGYILALITSACISEPLSAVNVGECGNDRFNPCYVVIIDE